MSGQAQISKLQIAQAISYCYETQKTACTHPRYAPKGGVGGVRESYLSNGRSVAQ